MRYSANSNEVAQVCHKDPSSRFIDGTRVRSKCRIVRSPCGRAEALALAADLPSPWFFSQSFVRPNGPNGYTIKPYPRDKDACFFEYHSPKTIQFPPPSMLALMLNSALARPPPKACQSYVASTHSASSSVSNSSGTVIYCDDMCNDDAISRA